MRAQSGERRDRRGHIGGKGLKRYKLAEATQDSARIKHETEHIYISSSRLASEMSQSSLCSVRASCLLRAASTSASLESTPMGKPVLSERTDCKNDIDGFSEGDRAQDGAGCAAPPAPTTGAEGRGDAAATRGGGCGRGGGGGDGCWRNVSLARSQTSQRVRPSEMYVDHSQSAAPNATAARWSCLY